MIKNDSNRSAPEKRRLSCLLLAMLLTLMLPLSGCAFIKKTSAYQYFNPPSMVLAGEYPCVYPNIEECWNSEEINRRLAEYYGPLMSAVSSADAGYELFVPEFSMDGAHGEFTIHGTLRCCLGGELPLPDVFLDNGELTFGSGDIDTSALDDSLLTAGTLFLEKLGLSESIGDMSDGMTLPDLYGLFVGIYEGVTCSPTDISRFSDDVSYSDLYMKAKSLGLPVIEFELEEENEETATCYSFAECATALMQALMNDFYGVSSLRVSRTDTVDMAGLFMDFFKGNPFFFDDWTGYADRFRSSEYYGVPAGELSRQSFATLWTSAYTELFGEIRLDDAYYVPEVSDTEDEECVKCLYTGMMETFPSYKCFSPEYYVHMFELPEYCRSFAWVCYNKWLENYDYAFSIDYNNEDIVRAISRTMIYMSRFSPAKERKTVINGRDYNWYVSQFNTGRYADINCMPTITAMAARWYYGLGTDITAQKLREDWLPDYSEGWYMFQVTASLDKYSIPNEELNFDEENGTGIICGELDRGRIILTQMSEAELGVSGHCLVIFGYKKCGDSVRFLVHDPGIYNGTDDFGRYPGDSIYLDSSYVNWIICRITCDIVSVGI